MYSEYVGAFEKPNKSNTKKSTLVIHVTPCPNEVHSKCDRMGAYVHQVPL